MSEITSNNEETESSKLPVPDAQRLLEKQKPEQLEKKDDTQETPSEEKPEDTGGKQKEEKLVLNLPEDKGRVNQLEQKLEEYRRRQENKSFTEDPYKAPEQISETEKSLRDAHYKTALLEALIKDGSVDAQAFMDRMKLEKDFNQNDFYHAFGAIEDYIETGGENLIGGTGLPNTEVLGKKQQSETEEFYGEEGVIQGPGPGETIKDKIEESLEILKDQEVMRRKPEQIAGAFREVTGEDFVTKREEMLSRELEIRHLRIVRGKNAIEQYRQQIVKREELKILSEEHSRALSTLWEKNPNLQTEEARTKFLNGIRKKLGLAGAQDGDMALDRLINNGFEVEKAKRGWFSGKVKIPQRGGRAVLIFNNKKDVLGETTVRVNILVEAQIRADLKIIDGKRKLLAERAVCTKKIIEQAVAKYELEKKQKLELESMPPENLNEAKPQKGRRARQKPKEVANGWLEDEVPREKEAETEAKEKKKKEKKRKPKIKKSGKRNSKTVITKKSSQGGHKVAAG